MRFVPTRGSVTRVVYAAVGVSVTSVRWVRSIGESVHQRLSTELEDCSAEGHALTQTTLSHAEHLLEPIQAQAEGLRCKLCPDDLAVTPARIPAARQPSAAKRAPAAKRADGGIIYGGP